MMSIENFSAGVQYDDYKGSTAADNQDINNIYKYLEGKQLKIKDKVIVGISLDASHLSLILIMSYLLDFSYPIYKVKVMFQH
ncbi:hypothetical protein IC611_02800 [Proteus mirabilis]